MAPIGARSWCCWPSTQSTRGIQLSVLVGEQWLEGKKIGGTGVGETLTSDVQLSRVIMKSSLRQACV